MFTVSAVPGVRCNPSFRDGMCQLSLCTPAWLLASLECGRACFTFAYVMQMHSAERVETLFLSPGQLLCALMLIRHKVKNKNSLRCTFFFPLCHLTAPQSSLLPLHGCYASLVSSAFEYGLFLLLPFTKQFCNFLIAVMCFEWYFDIEWSSAFLLQSSGWVSSVSSSVRLLAQEAQE